MKRLWKYIFLAISLWFSWQCISFGLSEDNDTDKGKDSTQVYESGQTYILSSSACRSVFGLEPNQMESALMRADWSNGHFQSAKQNEEGNLVLVLSEEDIEHWKQYFNDIIQTREEIDAADGYLFSVSEDYKHIETDATKEDFHIAVLNMGYIAAYCGVMQMLNGEDMETWYVDLKLFDHETSVLIDECRFPQSNFEVSEEEWDAALQNVEQNGEISTE